MSISSSPDKSFLDSEEFEDVTDIRQYLISIYQMDNDCIYYLMDCPSGIMMESHGLPLPDSQLKTTEKPDVERCLTD